MSYSSLDLLRTFSPRLPDRGPTTFINPDIVARAYVRKKVAEFADPVMSSMSEPTIPGAQPRGRDSVQAVEARSPRMAAVVPYKTYLRDVEMFRAALQRDPTSIYPEWGRVKGTREAQEVYKVLPYAAALQKHTGLPASDTVSRMLYETGNGASWLWNAAHAMGGVKAGGWSGVKARTRGGNVYRAYGSTAEGFYNYGDLMLWSNYKNRWGKMLGATFANAVQRSLYFGKAILSSGYCPDRDYLSGQYSRGRTAGVYSIDDAVARFNGSFNPLAGLKEAAATGATRLAKAAIKSDPTQVVARSVVNLAQFMGILPATGSDVSVASTGGMTFASPFRGGTLKVNSRYKRSSGKYHGGLDLGLVEGTYGAKIFSMTDGEVIDISNSNGGIVTVKVQDDQGRPAVLRYVHMAPTRELSQRFQESKKAGQPFLIKTGEAIGSLIRRGTGNWSGWHLHVDYSTIFGTGEVCPTFQKLVQWGSKAFNLRKTNIDEVGNKLAGGKETAYIEHGDSQREITGASLRGNPSTAGPMAGGGGGVGAQVMRDYSPLAGPYRPDLGGTDIETGIPEGPGDHDPSDFGSIFFRDLERAKVDALDSMGSTVEGFTMINTGVGAGGPL